MKGRARHWMVSSVVASLASLMLGGAALVGCPGPTFVVQQYPGDVRPQGEIATLRFNGSDPIRLAGLDDQDVGAPLDVDSHLHIEVLPGRHLLAVVATDDPHAYIEPVAFVAEPGKFYRVTLEGTTAKVFEAKGRSDELVREVTAPRGAGEERARRRGTPNNGIDAGASAVEPSGSPPSGTSTTTADAGT